MHKSNQSLLIVTDWFEPGSRAGGPIRSTANIAKLLSSRIDVAVLTGSHDLGSKLPYEGVDIGNWNQMNEFRVWYATSGQLRNGAFSKCIRDCKPQSVYLNSMFSVHGTIVPLLRLMGNRNIRVVLAPRGMLKPSALTGKRLKKKVWLQFLKASRLSKKIHFHATSADEAKEIQQIFGNAQSLSVIPNLPRYPLAQLPDRQKNKGEAKLVFTGRVHPIKNLDYALKALKNICYLKCSLDVIGPIEDIDYHGTCQSLCRELPSNVTVNFLGNRTNAEACEILAGADALISPTLGENFGHAIFEAFSLGVPVIISDQTCWRNLSDHNAGWDLPLSMPESFTNAINRIIQMDDLTHRRYQEGALNFAHSFFQSNDLESAYLQMFFPRN